MGFRVQNALNLDEIINSAIRSNETITDEDYDFAHNFAIDKVGPKPDTRKRIQRTNEIFPQYSNYYIPEFYKVSKNGDVDRYEYKAPLFGPIHYVNHFHGKLTVNDVSRFIMDYEVFLSRSDTYELSNWYEKYSEIKNEVIDSLIAARKEQAAFKEEERKALAAKAEEEEKKVRKAFQMWAFKTDDSILPKVISIVCNIDRLDIFKSDDFRKVPTNKLEEIKETYNEVTKG